MGLVPGRVRNRTRVLPGARIELPSGEAIPIEQVAELPVAQRAFVLKESGTSSTASGAQSLRILSELSVAQAREALQRRLSDQSNRLEFRQRKTGWPVRTDAVGEAQWKEEMALVATVHERLVQVVTAFDPRRLDKPPGPNTKRIAVEYIHGIGEHTLYHTAQIKMLKTLARKAGF